MRVLILLFTLVVNTVFAGELSVPIYATDEKNTYLGQVHFSNNPYGLLITPQLSGLPSGIHGFHLHEKGSCKNGAMAAGGHYDPQQTGSHQGPYGKGHLGDLPVLLVSDGIASTPVLAPRLKLQEIKGLALMVHQGGDNYSDKPPLGGGGKRIACGVLKTN